MCSLATRHIDERQKKAKTLAAGIDAEDQRDGHHFSETGVFGQDLVGLELFLEGPVCVDQCGNSRVGTYRVIDLDA